jgi:hypothetical protein
MQSISHSPIEFVPPLNQDEYLAYCHKLEQGICDNTTEYLKELINLRSKYVFLRLKEITNSTIDNFDFINAYDNDAGIGFFDHKEFKENISFMGNFSDKYSKPFGYYFPTKFLFQSFENEANVIYSNFLMEKAVIFDSSSKSQTRFTPKEYTYV